MVRELPQGRWPTLVGAICLTCLVGFVFCPIVDFEFADLDVREHVVFNPHIQGLTLENVGHLLTSRCITSYYPIRSLTFAVDYHIAGADPRQFKRTNGLIHLANVLLVYGLALRLLRRQSPDDEAPAVWREVFIATFSAGVFALHPVVVEPVVWVPGREELLMVLGALGCVHFHLTARRLDDDHRRAAAVVCYVGAAFCCLAACLSNAVAAVIPALIVAWDLLALARPKLWRIVYGTSALWVIGAVTIVGKRVGDSAEITAIQPAVFSAQRLMLIPAAYWHNLRSIAWPTDLALCYDDLSPRHFLETEVFLGAVALAVTCFVFWKSRRSTLFGLVWFALALGPVSQIMPHHVHRADRFLYLPLVGLVVALAMVLQSQGNSLTRAALRGVIAVAVASLALLGALSIGQCETWRTNLLLWHHCVKVAPHNPMPHRMLADSLASAGRFDLAIKQYEEALRLDPNHLGTLNNYAWYLAAWKEESLRDYDRAIGLAERACELTAWQDLHTRSTLALACQQFGRELDARGEFSRAVLCYRKALEAKPDDEMSVLDLVMLLATCGDPAVRDPDEAVRIAREACDRAGSPDPLSLAVLAEACAEAGRFDEAVAAAEEAIQIAEATGNQALAAELRSKRTLYQSGAPSYKAP